MSFFGSKMREVALKRAQKRKKRTMTTFIAGLALVILVLVSLWSTNIAASQPVDHFVDYDRKLVVYDQPLQAIHEMNLPANQESPFSGTGPQPKIDIEPDFFDFKNVGATEVIQHEFIVRNKGESALIINSAITTCACTTADFSGTIIPPGKIAIVTLTFDAGYHDTRGQTVRRGVIIQTNDPANPQVEIWTQAAVSMTP